MAKKQLTPEEKRKAQTEIYLNAWNQAIINENEKLKATHDKREFTFSTGEQRQITKLYTIQTIAGQTIDDKLNNDVLPRVGITPTNEVKITYDLTVGRFAVWEPKPKETDTPQPVEQPN